MACKRTPYLQTFGCIAGGLGDGRGGTLVTPLRRRHGVAHAEKGVREKKEEILRRIERKWPRMHQGPAQSAKP